MTRPARRRPRPFSRAAQGRDAPGARRTDGPPIAADGSPIIFARRTDGPPIAADGPPIIFARRTDGPPIAADGPRSSSRAARTGRRRHETYARFCHGAAAAVPACGSVRRRLRRRRARGDQRGRILQPQFVCAQDAGHAGLDRAAQPGGAARAPGGLYPHRQAGCVRPRLHPAGYHARARRLLRHPGGRAGRGRRCVLPAVRREPAGRDAVPAQSGGAADRQPRRTGAGRGRVLRGERRAGGLLHAADPRPGQRHAAAGRAGAGGGAGAVGADAADQRGRDRRRGRRRGLGGAVQPGAGGRAAGRVLPLRPGGRPAPRKAFGRRRPGGRPCGDRLHGRAGARPRGRRRGAAAVRRLFPPDRPRGRAGAAARAVLGAARGRLVRLLRRADARPGERGRPHRRRAVHANGRRGAGAHQRGAV